MNYTPRPYNGESDLSVILALKQVCTAPQTLYDRPTTSDLHWLLAPAYESTTRSESEQTWEGALRGLSPEHRQRALTQLLTALWEDASGQLVAYAVIAQPGSSLSFQVHPEAQGQGLKAAGFLTLPERDLRLASGKTKAALPNERSRPAVCS